MAPLTNPQGTITGCPTIPQASLTFWSSFHRFMQLPVASSSARIDLPNLFISIGKHRLPTLPKYKEIKEFLVVEKETLDMSFQDNVHQNQTNISLACIRNYLIWRRRQEICPYMYASNITNNQFNYCLFVQHGGLHSLWETKTVTNTPTPLKTQLVERKGFQNTIKTMGLCCKGRFLLKNYLVKTKKNCWSPATSAGSFYFLSLFSSWKLFYSMVYGNTSPWIHIVQID